MSRGKNSRTGRIGMRVTDQETARVVAVLGKDDAVVGAGCLVDHAHILTCYHVVKSALNQDPRKNAKVKIIPIGIVGQKPLWTRVIKLGIGAGGKLTPANDLALLEIVSERLSSVPPMEFATPLRHSGKKYSVLGFPEGDAQGRSASGNLHAADAVGLVQMDGSSALFVKGGFSGAPVWSPDLQAFTGIVVAELYDVGVAWCIPSRILCAFYPDLVVRFRIPKADRPVIHDEWVDDPNLQLFGNVSNNGERKLTASIYGDDGNYVIKATYMCLKGSRRPRGSYVTFITYPSFESENADAYELFEYIENGHAKVEFYPNDLFILAAVGDGGDTALTLDLSKVL